MMCGVCAGWCVVGWFTHVTIDEAGCGMHDRARGVMRPSRGVATHRSTPVIFSVAVVFPLEMVSLYIGDAVMCGLCAGPCTGRASVVGWFTHVTIDWAGCTLNPEP